MSPINVDILYRPIRIGFCVRSENFEDYRKAIMLTHTLWGGKFNPVIPIDDFDLACSLIDIFRVDLLFPVSEDPKVVEFIKKFNHLSNPLLSDVFNNGMKEPRFVDISHSLNKLYKNEYKNCVDPKLQICIFDWNLNDPLADLFLAKFGKLPPKEEVGVDYCSLIENNMKTKKIFLDSKDPLPIDDGKSLVLGSFSTIYLEEDYTINNLHINPGFYFGSANNFYDLVNYWNLQAAGIALMFYDVSHSERFESNRLKYLEMINKPVEGKSINVEIWYQKETILPDLAAWGYISTHVLTNNNIRNYVSQASYVLFSKESGLGIISKNYSGALRLSIQLHSKPFIECSDVGQIYVLSIQPRTRLLNNEDETLNFPYIPELNHFYDRACTFEIGRTRVEPKGLGIISEIIRSEFSLNLVKVTELILKIFSINKIKANLSNAGKVAKQLIRQMGGLQGCRPFKVEGVRNLIATYKPHECFTFGRATDLIFENKKYLNQEIYIEGNKLSSTKLFEHLLKKEVFSAGLSVDCPNCHLKFWISIDKIEKLAVCDFCRDQFNIAPHLKQIGSFQYRRSGLFGGYDNQHGSIPVALTLQVLDQALGFEGLIYIASTECKGRNLPKCESDFIAIPLKRDRYGKVEIVIAECKSKGGEITQEDVLKLGAIADSFPIDKFAVYIVFSKLGNFSSLELTNIKSLNKKTSRTIIFTSRELDTSMQLCSNLYENLRKELGCGTLYSGNLTDMANITNNYILSSSQGYPSVILEQQFIENNIAFNETALKLKILTDSFNFRGSDVLYISNQTVSHKFTSLFNNNW